MSTSSIANASVSIAKSSKNLFRGSNSRKNTSQEIYEKYVYRLCLFLLRLLADKNSCCIFQIYYLYKKRNPSSPSSLPSKQNTLFSLEVNWSHDPWTSHHTHKKGRKCFNDTFVIHLFFSPSEKPPHESTKFFSKYLRFLSKFRCFHFHFLMPRY